MFCPGCGSPLVDGQAFCSQCGEPVGGNARRSVGGAVSQPNSVAQGGGVTRDGNVISNAVNRAVKEVSGHVDNYYGATEQVDLKFSDFFSEVTKKHTHKEAEEIFDRWADEIDDLDEDFMEDDDYEPDEYYSD